MVALKASRSIFSRSGRHVGRRHERPADALPGIEELDRLLLLGVAREVEHERHILEVGIGRGAALEQDRDLLVR